MCTSTREPPREHVVELPELTQEEMEILCQKPANPQHVFVQGLALSLYDEKGGFYKALEVLLMSCKDISQELVQEMLENTIARLLRGDVITWCKLCKYAEKRPECPVCQLILKISYESRKIAA